MEGQEGCGSNDDVPLSKPSGEPKGENIPGGEQIREEDQQQFGGVPGTDVAPFQYQDQFGGAPDAPAARLQQSHDQFGEAPPPLPGDFDAPSQSALKSMDIALAEIQARMPPIKVRPVDPPSAKHSSTEQDPTHSFLSHSSFAPPQQFPNVPYQQGMAMDTQHSTPHLFPSAGSSTASSPLPAPMQPQSDDRHGVKRLAPENDEFMQPGQKRGCYSPILGILNNPPPFGFNPDAPPFGREVRPATTEVGGRFKETSSLAIRAFDPSGISITLAPPGNQESLEQRPVPGGDSITLSPPGNRETLEKRPVPGGESLTLALPEDEFLGQRPTPGGESHCLTLAPPASPESSKKRPSPGGKSLTLSPPDPDVDTDLKM